MILKLLVFIAVIYTVPSTCIKLNKNRIGLKHYYITSTRLNPKKLLKRSVDCHHLGIQWDTNYYDLCLNLWNGVNGELIGGDVKIFTANSTEHSFEELDISLVKGHVVNHENSSAIDGFLDNWIFYGRIIVEQMVLYVENVNNFPDIIKENGMNNVTDMSVVYRSLNELYKHMSHRELKFDANKGNLCSMMIIVDNSFYKLEAGSNLKNAISTVLSSVIRVNAIFRSTDFDNDGFPDNIGFKVMYVTVNTDGNSSIVPYSSLAMNSDAFLKKLSYLQSLKKVCLGVLFTAQTFTNNVIGISYTALVNETATGKQVLSGGICKHGFQNLNIVAITYFDVTHNRLMQALCDYSLAHEVGHSFGGRHDPKECEGYIMSSLTPQDITQFTYSFSPCSIKQMNDVITMRRNTCFEHDQSSFCGNELVEDDEECDCGSIYRCHYIDHCCVKPINHEGCKINRKDGYTCHPSEGLCCTTSCTIRNITHLGLTCDSFRLKCNSALPGPCGVGGECINGNCHSYECTRLGLHECKCPEKINATMCSTCCRLNHTCITAEEATIRQLEHNTEMILAVKNHVESKQFRETSTDVTQRICHEEQCVHVGHKIFPIKQFCVYKGNLGVCSASGRCDTTIPVFPQLPLHMMMFIRDDDDDVSSGCSIFHKHMILVSLFVYVVRNQIDFNIF